MRKNQFKRVEPGLSLYEGRTRGKRMKYTYSDEDEDISYSDATSTRRSTHNTRNHTPAGPAGPTITQSGRQVKSRQGGTYGESMLSGQQASAPGRMDGASDSRENSVETGGRPRRAAAVHAAANGFKPKGGRHIEGYNNVDELDSDEEGDASEQDYGDDEEEDDNIPLESDVDDQDDLTDEDEEMDTGEKKQLIVKLTIKTPTPEKKKTLIKLHLSPGKVPMKPLSPPAPANGSGVPSTASTQADLSTSVMDVEKTEKVTTLGTTNQVVSDSSEEASKPINIPPKSPEHKAITFNPLSPSLAFRGSPDKAAAFPPPIDVGARE